jgi:hypothetical protein
MSPAGFWGQLSQPPSWEVCAIKGGHALQKCIFIAAEGACLIFLCILLTSKEEWMGLNRRDKQPFYAKQYLCIICAALHAELCFSSVCIQYL